MKWTVSHDFLPLNSSCSSHNSGCNLQCQCQVTANRYPKAILISVQFSSSNGTNSPKQPKLANIPTFNLSWVQLLYIVAKIDADCRTGMSSSSFNDFDSDHQGPPKHEQFPQLKSAHQLNKIVDYISTTTKLDKSILWNRKVKEINLQKQRLQQE